VYVRTGFKIRLGLVLKVLCVSSSFLPACPFCQFSCLTVTNVRYFSGFFHSCILNYMIIRVELILTPRYVIPNSGTHHFHGLIRI
jgi:hypothetical protein